MPDNVKHGPYITELKAGFSVFKEVIAPQFGVSGEQDLGGADFSLGWSFLTKPFLMVKDAHRHDFDQFVFFCGGDPNNVVEFGAEVEFGVDGKLAPITYPACVYIPRGVVHGPLNVKRITRPIMFIDITISPGYSVRPMPPGPDPATP